VRVKKSLTLKPDTNRIVSGILIIGISLWWCAFNLNLFYKYHFTSSITFLILPDWLLFLNILMSVAGILIGVSFLRKGKKLKGAIVFFTALSILAILINLFSR
jgi:hypothetical protein